MEKVKEIMTDTPFSCKEDETIQQVANQMSKSNIGFLPVIDKNQKVVGTITDRDVVLSLARTAKTPAQLKVQEVMRKETHTVDPEDDATKALEIMRTRKVRRIPVVDSDKRLRGIVSLTGLARRIRNSSNRNHFEYQGKENIISTLHALADRDSNRTGETALG
jgi:CBS domain-containing protein